MSIPNATGGRSELVFTTATILPAGTGMATAGIIRHEPTAAEKAAEAARLRIEAEKRAQALHKQNGGSIFVSA